MLFWEIENGEYDEIIQSNNCDEWAERMISKYQHSDEVDISYDLYQCIKDRIYAIDKNLAFKYSDIPDIKFKYESSPYSYEYRLLDGNENRFDDTSSKTKRKQVDAAWNYHDYPELFDKNGNTKFSLTNLKKLKNRSNIFGASYAANSEPLHRKGSLNRDLLAMDKQKKQ
jgi:hypothetical protein